MGLILEYEDGQTPLDEEEREGLLIDAITTREALDEFEQRNIEEALRWTIERRRKFTATEILTTQFICELHRKMFYAIWKWAGTFRNSNKNIGVDKYQVATELRVLLDDCKYWIANSTFGPDEIAIRFKHRLVAIHCFSNGNGRHSRLMADIIIEKIFASEVYTWGSNRQLATGKMREKYLKALKKADKGEYSLLMKFARS